MASWTGRQRPGAAAFLDSVVRARLELEGICARGGPPAGGTEGDAEVLADLDGRDKEILLERGAELLKRSNICRSGRCGWAVVPREGSH
jgi:hypothetical protein